MRTRKEDLRLIGGSALATAVFAVSVLLALPAFADGSIRLDPSLGEPGDSILIIGDDFDDEERVKLCWGESSCANLGWAQTSDEERFSKRIVIPASAKPGRYTITACADDACGRATVNVVASESEPEVTSTSAVPTSAISPPPPTTTAIPPRTTTTTLPVTKTLQPVTTTLESDSSAEAPGTTLDAVEEAGAPTDEVSGLAAGTTSPTSSAPQTATTTSPATSSSMATSTTEPDSYEYSIPTTLPPGPSAEAGILRDMTGEVESQAAGDDSEIPSLTTEAGRNMLVVLWLALTAAFIVLSFWFDRYLRLSRRSKSP